MPDQTPHTLAITDADIDAVAKEFHCDFSDAERREVLRCASTRDVQACPGSGKTTLLVAKLAILSSKWTCRDQGMCVLSHTNVAREEIEKRLAYHPTGHRILSYPHFVGTIQTFVDTFLALPCLRNRGKRVAFVDNDLFRSRILKLSRTYRYIQTLMAKKRQQGRQVVRNLHFSFVDGSLELDLGRLRLGANRPTFKELLRLKVKIRNQGILRFDDMYAFAQEYIHRFPCLINAMRLRFPWVFIDEMQDTNSLQEKLLNDLFQEGVILQRFGDTNQAIFGDEDSSQHQNSFPRQHPLIVSTSKRFSVSIARLACPLTADCPQSLEGNPDHPHRRHTIFLFDKRSVHRVPNAFGDLVAEQYKPALPSGFTARIVGLRKKPPERALQAKFPFCVGCYWPGFQPDATSTSANPASLAGYVGVARTALRRSGECGEPYDILLRGILRLLHAQGVNSAQGEHFTKTGLIQTMRDLDDQAMPAFKMVLRDLLLTREPPTAQSWSRDRLRLREALAPLISATLTDEARDLIKWRGAPSQPTASADTPPDSANIYRCIAAAHGLEIPVGTIHSVKGQTHTALLLLETFLKNSYDLRALLPFLCRECDRTQLKPLLRRQMKCDYVAMTRPTELLCLAICKDHIDLPRHRQPLQARGWTIRDLTAEEPRP